MALLSDKLKSCGVRVEATVGGVPSFGSGVIYSTPNYCSYNYILTAKHIFQEDSRTPLDIAKIFNITISYSNLGKLKKLDFIKKSEIEKKLIVFDEDFIIIVVKKIDFPFPQILVSDNLKDDDLEFFSWGVFTANKTELNHFHLKRKDQEMKRFQADANLNATFLPGLSGAGVFMNNRSILYGIIYQYPNQDFQNNTIDCSLISFSQVNTRLKSLNRVQLDLDSSSYKREINNDVIYIHEAKVNNVIVDLELARKRLKTDIQDDWYHDPLKYIDLLNQDYLFKQFALHFNGVDYKASLAEKFYVPKKQFTLRQALISPFIDRIMYLAAVGVLAENLDNAMIPSVYSARYNRYAEDQLILNGVEQWKKMQYKLSECSHLKDSIGDYLYGCVIEIDLLNFYDNINKKLLHDKVLRVCKLDNERNAAILLNQILTDLSQKESGLPQNCDSSSLLASFYLNQVDVFMHTRFPGYYRFMDDIRIFCKDKYEARRILQIFEFELRRCYLSVNSQKTRILSYVKSSSDIVSDTRIPRTKYDVLFDLELNQISRLRTSTNYAYLNEAFHLSVSVLADSIDKADTNGSDEIARKLNYALNSIAVLVKKNVNGLNATSEFSKSIELAILGLRDKPWITSQLCRVLNLLPQEIFLKEYLPALKDIVLDIRYNIYSFQTYQLWLLFARHKCDAPDLRAFAAQQIEINDSTNEASVAAMVIFMCSVDDGYRRVILRKFGENFAGRYFQNRSTLICLRSFMTDIVDSKFVNHTLKDAPEFTHLYKDKDLVFVPGAVEDSDSEEFEQLYSI